MNHSRLKGHFTAGTDIRLFMNIQSEVVSRTMWNMIACIFYYLHDDISELAHNHSRFQAVLTSILCFSDYVKHLVKLRIFGFPYCNSTGNIRAVSVIISSEINRHKITKLDFSIGCCRMTVCSVIRTRCYDRLEAESGAATASELIFQFICNIDLCNARFDHIKQCIERSL